MPAAKKVLHANATSSSAAVSQPKLPLPPRVSLDGSAGSAGGAGGTGSAGGAGVGCGAGGGVGVPGSSGGGSAGSSLRAAAIAHEKPLAFLNHQLYLRFGLTR